MHSYLLSDRKYCYSYFQVDLPDFDKDRKLRSFTLQEQREYFKREGIPPIRNAEYKPLFIDASSKSIFVVILIFIDHSSSFQRNHSKHMFHQKAMGKQH